MAVERFTFNKLVSGTTEKTSYYVCDLESEKPTSVRVGDLCLVAESGKLYKGTAVDTWTDQSSGGGGGGLWTRVVLSADRINNNAVANTLADVTGLSFAVTAGVRYWFRFWIVYTAQATSTGSRWTLNGPAFTGLSYMSEYSLTGTTSTRNARVIAYSLPAASNATSAATGPSNVAQIEGFIQPSANGTVIARFASEVANSAITAKVGSFVEHTSI